VQSTFNNINADITEQGRSIFMIDASRGFMKDGNKNRLRSQDIHKMVDVFNKQLPISRYSRMVAFAEIMSNDYNLNIPRYIDSSEPEDIHDLSAHLQGGIPNRDIDALDAYWQVFPSIRASLFADDRAGYSQSLVASNQVKSTILNHNEFKAFAKQSLTPFNEWSARAALTELTQDEPPKAVIHRISEDLLASYADSRLLSKYDIYQILMDYWASIMQDDVYVLVQDGWQAGNGLRKLINKKGQKLNETPDLVINKVKYKATLIAPALIIQRYFATEQAHIDSLQAELDNATQALDSYIEEHSDEDGLLVEALNDKDKITKVSIANRIKLNVDAPERQALKHTQTLYDAENKAKKSLKDAQDALDMRVFMQYPTLSEADVKTLIVEDKWLATLHTQIIAEIERITQRMTVRVQELDERYAEPLPAITQSVTALSRTVAEHLRAMGLEVMPV
jgi:type I restriction enzyme M protein